ncbi:MAG: hypothetical protein MJ014_07775 [Methanocorpusculum sp.]|nr:hypothetical protein [Methanocorpusculum sp.]
MPRKHSRKKNLNSYLRSSPQYLSGGTAESYPLSSDARTVYLGSIAFVYEKIKIKITDTAYATSIAYMSGSTNPSAKAAASTASSTLPR